ncbi:hypothetical protein LKD70_17840 [Ruminococcus sp. CLA-AA-H200]|uniref:SsuA/THI5-like domain-containing protein n=1 Tax=Ruminococcus turbiniformis TaxID=2881258 RepID=A0ABS8G5P1_9FIRM|nr:hypothetical protein [Ruminococcus turbiniformis]MCC2256244.1 hypothetical protein [Ruminococcus turbiniformis]
MKKMTRFISLLLAVIMLMALCAGCGSDSAGSDSAGSGESSSGDSENTSEENELTTVKIGITPYSMYVIWALADEWGIAEDYGLDLELTSFTGTAQGAQACVRGDVDITSACVNEHIACVETCTNLVNFSPLGDFRGFFFVGREAEISSWDSLVEEHDGDIEAAKEERLNDFKGSSWCVIPQRKALIVDAISQVGLTADDVTFIEFADDAKACEAFLAGEGDYYTGGDQQQMALMDMGGYVNAGGSDLLGPSGVWYDTFVCTDEFLNENYDLAKTVYECQLATVNAFNNNQQAGAEIASAYLTEATGSEYPVDDWFEMQTQWDIYVTLEDAANRFFNPEDSTYYWKTGADYNVKLLQDEGSITSDVDTDYYFKQSEEMFNDINSDEAAVEKINSYKTFEAP